MDKNWRLSLDNMLAKNRQYVLTINITTSLPLLILQLNLPGLSTYSQKVTGDVFANWTNTNKSMMHFNEFISSRLKYKDKNKAPIRNSLWRLEISVWFLLPNSTIKFTRPSCVKQRSKKNFNFKGFMSVTRYLSNLATVQEKPKFKLSFAFGFSQVIKKLQLAIVNGLFWTSQRSKLKYMRCLTILIWGWSKRSFDRQKVRNSPLDEIILIDL